MARMGLSSDVALGRKELECAKEKAGLAGDKWDIDNHQELRPYYLEPGTANAPETTLRLRKKYYEQNLRDYQRRCAGR